MVGGRQRGRRLQLSNTSPATGHAAPPRPLIARAPSLLNRSIMQIGSKFDASRADGRRSNVRCFSAQRPATAEPPGLPGQTSTDTSHRFKNSPSDNKRRHNTTIKLVRPTICAEGDRNRGAPEEASRRSAEMDDDGPQHLESYHLD